MKYTNYAKMKMNRSSGISKTIYDNGGYLLLFGKKELQSFEIYV